MNDATTTPIDTTDCIGCWNEVAESDCCPECGRCLATCCTCVAPEPEETFEPRKWRYERPLWNLNRY